MTTTRSLCTLLIALALSACGSSSSTTEPAAATSTSGGENAAPVELRVRGTPGARYETYTVARTQAPDGTVLTTARGSMDVERVDAATDVTHVRTHIHTIELTDGAGQPMQAGSAAALDLSGAVFRRAIDARAATVGSVTVEGTTEVNAAMAETMRSMFEQATVRLPEQPVRVGETWRDTVQMTVPLDGRVMMTFECTTTSRLARLEGSGDRRLAVIELVTDCASEPVRLAAGEAALGFAITSHGTGESRLALEDGIAGQLTMNTETITTMGIEGQPEEVIVMQQHVQTITTPIVD